MFKNLCLVFDYDDKDRLFNNDMGDKKWNDFWWKVCVYFKM